MGTTPGGLPYPEGTSKLVAGDNDIKALAQAVDSKLSVGSSRVQAGQAVVTTNAFGAAAITPPLPLVAPFPVLFVQDASADNTTIMQMATRFEGPGPSFNVFVWNKAGTATVNNATLRINWLAIA